MTPIDPRTANRFLLGELPEDERERLERLVLEDRAAGDELAAAEDDLLDAYAAGELPRAERRAFERRLRGSADLRRRAAFARALARAARGDASAAGRSGGAVVAWPASRRGAAAPLAGLAAAASVVLAVACGWLAWRGEVLTDRVADLERSARELSAERDQLAARSGELDRRLAGAGSAAERRAGELEGELALERERAAGLEAELARRRTAPPAPVTASFVLSAALRSDRGDRQLALEPGVERVHLTFDLGVEESFSSFLVVVEGPRGEVWSQRGLPPARGAAGTAVELTLPAEVLAGGGHEALVFGEPDAAGGELEMVGSFPFEPVRR